MHKEQVVIVEAKVAVVLLVNKDLGELRDNLDPLEHKDLRALRDSKDLP